MYLKPTNHRALGDLDFKMVLYKILLIFLLLIVFFSIFINYFPAICIITLFTTICLIVQSININFLTTINTNYSLILLSIHNKRNGHMYLKLTNYKVYSDLNFKIYHFTSLLFSSFIHTVSLIF